MKDVPIIINSKNRLTYLRRLINRLQEMGYHNIFILDTGSTYPPLLEYYQTLKFPRFMLTEQEAGPNPHLALWAHGLPLGIRGKHFIYTDCDVLPNDQCPHDLAERLFLLLQKYPLIPKAGLALDISDLPFHYAHKHSVLVWEKQFWATQEEPDVFHAPIDTTFAMYRPETQGWAHALRVAGPYIGKHLPWYEDSEKPTEEILFYRKSKVAGVGHWP